jgi:DNA-binding GntR family transcriptional regulator
LPTRTSDRYGDVLESVLEPAERRTLTGSTVDRLRTLILAGDLPPGTPLRLRAVAARLGVSNMPVREALRTLEAERLVVVIPHRGATVLQISSDEVEEIYAMRAGLERLAARRAMERILPEEVIAIQTQFKRMEEAAETEDLDRFFREDRRFHDMLYMAAQRPSLEQRVHELARSSTRAVKLAYGVWRPLTRAVAAHQPLVDAIAAGDADRVARLTFAHVTEGGARIHAAVARWEAIQRAATRG